MKIRIQNPLAALALLLTLNLQPSTAFAQGTAFTYQGRLNDGGSPAHGTYDFRFRLAADPLANNYVGSSFLTNGVSMTNGLFTVTLDFGGGIFAGSNYWLEVDVRTNGGSSYTTLNPLQALTPTPYAVFAEGANAAGLSGTIAAANFSGTYLNPVTLNSAGNSFSGAFSGNGAGLTNLNVTTLGGLGADQFWKTTGNSGTSPTNGNFLGTTDNQPLELKVNGQRALRLEPTANDAVHSNIVNVVNGSAVNFAAPGVYAATVSGGGAQNYAGVAYTNSVASDIGTVAGGVGNTIQANSAGATISGGSRNKIQTFAYNTVIAGGVDNTIQTNSYDAIIGGGQNNTIQIYAYISTIGGGYANTIGSPYATISGGAYHIISTNSNSGTISGGYNNIIKDNTFDASIGGGSYQTIGTNSYYSTIAGGRYNSIPDNGTASTIAGGYYNTIRYGSYATIGGGYQNLAGNAATLTGNYSFVGGGAGNNAEGNYSTAPGGYQNWAPGDYSFAVGRQAKAYFQGDFVWADSQAADFYATANDQFSVRAAGGVRFVTSGAGLTLDGQPVLAGMVPSTSLSGTYSSAVNFNNSANSFTGNGSALTGVNAANISSGTLADARLSSNVALLNASQTFTGANTFASDISISGGAAYHHVQLSGGNALGYVYGSYPGLADGIHLGYNYYYDANGTGHISNTGGGTSRVSADYGEIVLAVGGVNTAPTTVRLDATTAGVSVYGTFNNFSDRNAKQDFAPVSSSQILDKVARLPVSEWSYKEDPKTRHVGPVAQDFYSIFNIGTDDKHIAPIDEGGVALAAIQGLNQKLEDRSKEMEVRGKQLEAENAELKARLGKLEQLIKQQNGGDK